MSIQGIGSISGDSRIEQISRQSGARGSTQSTVDRNTGPDTVSLSPEAMALFQSGSAATGEPVESVSGSTATDCIKNQQKATAASTGGTGASQGFNLFAFMLESLLMAEMDESDAAARATEEGQPQKKSSPLEDSGKVAELKKGIEDVAKGKAGIADIPGIMAKSGSAGSTGKSSPVTQDKDGTEKTVRS